MKAPREVLGTKDGRNISPSLGELPGEGAEQRVRAPLERAAPDLQPQAAPAPADSPTYHGLSVLKEPVWSWEIPAYFSTGGLAGACAVLGGAAQLVGGPRARPLVRRTRLLAAGSSPPAPRRRAPRCSSTTWGGRPGSWRCCASSDPPRR